MTLVRNVLSLVALGTATLTMSAFAASNDQQDAIQLEQGTDVQVAPTTPAGQGMGGAGM